MRRSTSPSKKRKRSESPPPRKNVDSYVPSKASSSRRYSTKDNNNRSRRSSVSPPPRSKQERRRDSSPEDYRSSRSYYSPPRPRNRWPRVRDGEATTQEDHDAVRESWNVRDLYQLWEELAAKQPGRQDLIGTVQDQIIRTQLYDMMGGPNATSANIKIDGAPKAVTVKQTSKMDRDSDRRRTDGSYRDQEVWNASLHDTEVGTIRDIKRWAAGVSKEELQQARKVVFQLVGTSGPCEACKARLQYMADDLLTAWSTRTGLTRDQLPEIQVWSYYGNPPETPQKRGMFRDVLNGWPGDPTPRELDFQHRTKRDFMQPVRIHRAVQANQKVPVVPTTTTTVPETTTGKTDKSEELVTK